MADGFAAFASIFKENKFIFTVLAFFVFIIFVYMPLSYLALFFKDKENKKWAEKNSAVKFYIKHGKTGFMDIYSINGEKPVIHRSFLKYGFYLLPGKNVIHAAYQRQPFLINLFRKLFGLSYIIGIKTDYVDDKKIEVTVEPDTEYVLFYDRFLKDYIFKENVQNLYLEDKYEK